MGQEKRARNNGKTDGETRRVGRRGRDKGKGTRIKETGNRNKEFREYINYFWGCNELKIAT